MKGAPPVPQERQDDLRAVLDLVAGAQRVVLTTHVNADGDGAGCEAALAGWLADLGKTVHIVNPTPFPPSFRYLVQDDQVVDPSDPRLGETLEEADAFIVVDTREAGRLGKLWRHFGNRPVAVLDHHPPSPEDGFPATVVQDITACAAGELVYDVLVMSGYAAPWPPKVVEAVYVAIVSDTGSFRYSNTGERTHLIAADLLRRGVDVEGVYRRVYGSVPLRRLQLLREALERLEHDPHAALTWVSLPRQVVTSLEAGSDDMDGIVEHARTVEDTEVALLFRELPDGSIKLSLRSNGALDVNAIARRFGGGGHAKAAGALLAGPLAAVREEVLEVTRHAAQLLKCGPDSCGQDS